MRNGHPDNRDLSLPDASLTDTDGRGGPFSVTGEQRANNTIVLAFAPLHKAALGLASGVVFASIFALVTLVDLVVDPRQIADLGLLAQYFYGYSVSIAGVFI